MEANSKALLDIVCDSESAESLDGLHSDLTPIECDACLQSFSETMLLQSRGSEVVQPDCDSFLNIGPGFLGEANTDSQPQEFLECPKCKKLCKSERGLSQHMGKVHCRKKRHSVCQLCKSRFLNKYALRFHIKQVHEQATRVACEVCGQVLYNKYLLPRHMARAHPPKSTQSA